MGQKQSPYEILGVSPDASMKEIQRAYRLLAVKHHPDKGVDNGKFLQVIYGLVQFTINLMALHLEIQSTA